MDSIPEGTRPESLHDQLVYLGDAERLGLRDIPSLALHWLETIVEMGGLPDTEQLQHSGFRRVTAEDSTNSPPFEDATSVVMDNGQRLWLRSVASLGSFRLALFSETQQGTEIKPSLRSHYVDKG